MPSKPFSPQRFPSPTQRQNPKSFAQHNCCLNHELIEKSALELKIGPPWSSPLPTRLEEEEDNVGNDSESATRNIECVSSPLLSNTGSGITERLGDLAVVVETIDCG